jgi:chemotaxis methyl-accepting protein methylase
MLVAYSVDAALGARVELSETESVYRGDLNRLLYKIKKERGLDLHQYRRAYVERRLAARMRALNMHTYRQYERFIDEHPEEYAKMLDTLTINVTDFFRDTTVYDVVREEILPQLIKDKVAMRQRSIRIWSAGCATGEEAYSIAIAVLGAMGSRADEFLLTVFGTDIDPKALETAKRGVYDLSKLEHIPKGDQRRFVETTAEGFTFSREVTQHLKFRRLNLFEDEPIKIVDAIFCRNVFIYFTREQQARVLERFWSALHKGGYLVLGRSEKMAQSLVGRFDLVSGRERVYRKPYNSDRSV